MTTLLAMADIHGNLPALQAVKADLGLMEKEIDGIAVAGDIVGEKGGSSRVIHLLVILGNVFDSHYVIGNHDARMRPEYYFNPDIPSQVEEYESLKESLSDSDVSWLCSLPRRIETHNFVVAHSWPARFQEAETSVVGFTTGDFGVVPQNVTAAGIALDNQVAILGHTHQQFKQSVDKFEGQSGLIVNPGSVGLPSSEGKAEYAIVDTEAQEAELCSVEYQ